MIFYSKHPYRTHFVTNITIFSETVKRLKHYLPNFFLPHLLFTQKETTMTNFLFSKPPTSKGYSLLLLALRIFFGLMLAMHGIDKLANYTELIYSFPDPFGFGSETSLVLAIFGEIGCSVAFIIGILYRLSMIPMIFVMGVAFFHIHQGDIAQGELAFLYLVVFIFMFFSGPGKYSVDATIYNHIHRKDED